MDIETTSVMTSKVTVSAADVDAAAERIKGIALLTPLHLSNRLSEQTGTDIWLKREDLQPVRSYKIRGAQNFLAQLNDAERAAGVICASAGNHGQGVALACASLGVRAQIFVPTTTPRQKRDRMIYLGKGHIELVVIGETFRTKVMSEAGSCSRRNITPICGAFAM